MTVNDNNRVNKQDTRRLDYKARQQLLLAYQQTDYRLMTASGDKCIQILNVGRHYANLDTFFPDPGEWYTITASNPGSKQRSETENRIANRELKAWLESGEIPHWPLVAVAQARDWPNEHGYLACHPGLTLPEKARALGQLAVLAGRPNTPCRLLFLQSGWESVTAEFPYTDSVDFTLPST